MSEKLGPLLKSRRFWVAVAGIVGIVFDVFGFNLSPEQINHVVLLGGAWIVGDSLRTAD
jgi:hypothetical protein